MTTGNPGLAQRYNVAALRAAHSADVRTPLEDGEVRLARRDGVVRYPARCQLVLAANPCPCAPPDDRDCVCAPSARRRYLGRLSGPLLDRVDLPRAVIEPIEAALHRGLVTARGPIAPCGWPGRWPIWRAGSPAARECVRCDESAGSEGGVTQGRMTQGGTSCWCGQP